MCLGGNLRLAGKGAVDGEAHAHDVLDEPTVHLLLVLLKPVVLAKVHTGGVAHPRHAGIVGGAAYLRAAATERGKEARAQLLARVVFHLLDEGVYGVPARHALGLVGGDELQVRPVAEHHRVLGIRDGVARAAEVLGQLALAHHVVDAVLQQRTLPAADAHHPCKRCLDVGPHVGHQCHVGLVNEERQLAWHVVHHADDAGCHDALGLARCPPQLGI